MASNESQSRVTSLERTLEAFRLDAEFHEEATLQYVQYHESDYKETFNWKNVRSLGEGTFGQVRQERLKDENGDWQYRAVKHCGLFVNLAGWWTDAKNLYIAMEYISSGDLSSYVQQGLSEVDAREIISDVANGLQVMHQEGFTHRDLKPQNILVVRKRPQFYKWHVKIADFGVSKRILEDAGSGLHTSIGTRPYSAPEVLGYLSLAQSSSVYTNKVDLWSLGCILFTIGSRGILPFSEPDLVRYCDGLLQFEPQKSCTSFGEEARSLLQALLQPNPSHRPSAIEVVDHQWFRSNSDAQSTEASWHQSLPQMQQTSSLIQSYQQQNYNSFLESTSILGTESNKNSPNHSLQQRSLATPTASPAAPLHEIQAEMQNEKKYQHIRNKMIGKPLRFERSDNFHRGHRPSNIVFSHDGKIVTYEAGQFFGGPVHETVLYRTRSHAKNIKACLFSPKNKLSGAYPVPSQSRCLDYGLDLHKIAQLWNTMINWGIWDIESIPTTAFHRYQEVIGTLKFSSDGQFLATTTMDLKVSLWNTKGRIHTFDGHTRAVTSLAFSPHNWFLASSSIDNTVRIWNVRAGTLEFVLDRPGSAVLSVAFSPLGHRLVLGAADGTIDLWNTANVELLRQISREASQLGTNTTINAVVFSPDGQWIAAGCSDCKIRLFDSATGDMLCIVTGHHTAVLSLAFSPDSTTLLSGDVGSQVRLWDTKSLR